MTKSDSAWLAAFLFLCCGASAAEPPQVEARIKFISMTRPLVGLGVAHGKQATGLVIPTDMLSDPIVYRGPARLELIETTVKERPTKGPSASPEEKNDASDRPSRGVKARTAALEHIPAGKPPLAWIDLPTNLGRLNLILLVTPGNKNGITMLNDPPGSFPPGSNRYLNLTSFQVIVKAPSGSYLIDPGAEKILRPGAPNNDYYDLTLSTKFADEEIMAFSSRVYHMEKVRKLYLIQPAPGAKGRLMVRDIEDRPPPTTALGPTPVAPKGAK
jgi:hypothetical protein